MNDNTLKYESSDQQALLALKKLVFTAASTPGLGDDIVDSYSGERRRIHPMLARCANDAHMSPEEFRDFSASRFRAEHPFNDIQLMCIGDKLHHWLDPEWKPKALLDLERELEAMSPQLVLA